MVRLATIVESNRLFAKENAEHGERLVCVFAGATSNTGAATVEQLAPLLPASIFYILGRSASRFQIQRAKLESLNRRLKIVFLETDVSLISSIDAACERIAAAESKVDYLYMSQGCIPLTVPQYTREGIDLCFALSYFSRIRLVSNLLPLLRASSRPRVLSVLNGGREKAIREDDMGLEDATHYSPPAAINHTSLMMTLALEHLAADNRQITFMHAFPGLVATDNFLRLTPPPSFGWVKRLTLRLFSWFISNVQWLFGMPAADCGARQAFLLTSAKYGPGEAWRIDQHSEAVSVPGVLERYRAQGWHEKVWEYTISIFEKTLATAS